MPCQQRFVALPSPVTAALHFVHVPQSALRILDCFLLEGTKVLFRIGLGVLKVNARHLLSITDPVALFQTLKEIAKHTFNIDQLLQVSAMA